MQLLRYTRKHAHENRNHAPCGGSGRCRITLQEIIMKVGELNLLHISKSFENKHFFGVASEAAHLKYLAVTIG